jgi:diaminohydroxyphosphoribosylaminopyrimidine deaminase/5-amino-6-(5-phosphoribosylamino)uracil reductase
MGEEGSLLRLFSDVSWRVADPHLREAYLLAERGRGSTAPNPVVGCVVVSPSGAVVGRGFHPRAGQPHAEVFALADAGDAARGATAYVTLEPCAHHGRTPPCVEALIAAGVARVVMGMRDPSAEAAGGAEKLVAAGIEVEVSDDPTPFAEQNRGWLKRLETGMPFVRVKLGLSLDARPAFEVGERAAMTGASGAEVTARLRAASDAVAVSAATVNADDPSLTVRGVDGTLAERQPLRVVLTRSSLPRDTAQVLTDWAGPAVVLAPSHLCARAMDALGAGVLVEAYDAALGLGGAFFELGRRGLSEVLVEPGPRLFTALWRQGLVDELVTVFAGGLAGAQAPGMYWGPSERDGDALCHSMAPVEAGIVGDVAVTVWRPAPDETC